MRAQNVRMSLYQHDSPFGFLELSAAARAWEFVGHPASDGRGPADLVLDERSDPWADLATWYRRLDEGRRTLICEPRLVDEANAMVEEKGLAGVFTVLGSPVCLPGQVFVCDTVALNAALQLHGQGR